MSRTFHGVLPGRLVAPLGSAWHSERDAETDPAEPEAMKYHHLGIPTTTPQAGEVYLERFKVYCTDHRNNPFGIQWMRYETDCPLPDLVKTVPHVAFEVEDLQAALVGREVLIEPNSPSEGVVVAFVVQGGAPVEFLQFLPRPRPETGEA